MDHLRITGECIGDKITSISECCKVAKAWGKPIDLYVDGIRIFVRPDSNTQDLISILMLEIQLKDLKDKKDSSGE